MMKILMMDRDGVIAARYINPKNLKKIKDRYKDRLMQVVQLENSFMEVDI
uniref:Uncharacterized protein n=1 Tax=viral metagenome TaxID=1070528 RepID=A0A6M3LP26_9ZZZZ